MEMVAELSAALDLSDEHQADALWLGKLTSEGRISPELIAGGGAARAASAGTPVAPATEHVPAPRAEAKPAAPDRQTVGPVTTFAPAPAQALFARVRRDFSHGCIRLEDPARFAEWVLRDQPAWTRARIDAAMKGERPTRVNLTEKLTVVIFYATVHVNSESIAFFVDDIYGHDRTLDAALAQGYPYPVKG
jgi:hypothetical protein